MAEQKEILVFAKRYNNKDPERIGGAIRLSEEFISDLKTLGESYSVIDINPANHGGFILSYIKVIAKALVCMKNHRCILFIGSDRVVAYLAPVILIIARIFGKRMSMKKLGGGFDQFYLKSNKIVQWKLRWLLRNLAVSFYETKHLVQFFAKFGRAEWFPNARNFDDRQPGDVNYSGKYAFISQVKNSKGVIEILEAAQELRQDYTLHIYGPIVDLEIPDHLRPTFEEVYQRPLKPEEVMGVIEKYDVIMLPTYYPGEGYPGILIESYAMGKPVISTQWNAIPEIIEHERTGLLIPPRDKGPLIEAIRWFNYENYAELSKEALKYSRQFNSLYQSGSKLNLIKGNE